eukprot:3758877-Prymnesium_polylepis.3
MAVAAHLPVQRGMHHGHGTTGGKRIPANISGLDNIRGTTDASATWTICTAKSTAHPTRTVAANFRYVLRADDTNQTGSDLGRGRN